jgi:hypothetical protein
MLHELTTGLHSGQYMLLGWTRNNWTCWAVDPQESRYLLSDRVRVAVVGVPMYFTCMPSIPIN